MIVELGHFALVLSLAVAVIQSVVPMAGAATGRENWMALARPAAQLQCTLLVLAFASLTYAFITHDFSVVYVAQNSNSLLPLMYRVSAVWGAHEGSLLLWVLILGFWSVAVSWFSHGLPEAFIARVLAVMGIISTGFLLFMLFTSNPFLRRFPAPPDGVDLNPLLQDPGLIIHPPMLYMGYVGFSVAFGFAIAALLGGKLDIIWARWSRPWTIAAWSFLTAGIALGSWWAYYELGWGGWWFWDPVENASFMPWLVGTALIHSLAATEKRGVFRNWTVLLAICTFALSLLGTFLVRSGVLTSVHAFATDPTRGVFILIFLGLVIGGSLLLYAWRASDMPRGNYFKAVSRETLLLLNSALLSVAAAAVLLGTVYPLVIEAFGSAKLSVGEPYFNAVFVPLMIPIAVVIGIGVSLRWRSDDWRRIWKLVRILIPACILLGVLLVAMLTGSIHIRTVLGITLALWIVAATLLAVRERLKYGKRGLSGLADLPSGFVGMCLAHVGFAVTIVGVSITSQYSLEDHRRMGTDDIVEMGGYTFQLETFRDVQGPNYDATEAVVNVSRNGNPVTTLHSQKRFYNVRNMPMTEAGIDPGLFRDLYVSLGEPLDNGDWSLRLYYRPMVRWIWLGAIFMVLGGILAARDKRYRIQLARPVTRENEAVNTTANV